MSGNDNAGRISKASFLGATTALFVVAIITVFFRLVIRLRYQKSIAADDVFLLLGTACMIGSFGLVWVFVDAQYLAAAFSFRHPTLDLRGWTNPMKSIQLYHKESIVCLVLSWTGTCCVKFSFLALFRKLVERTPWLRIYWWGVTIFTVIAWFYGIAAYAAGCPYYEGTDAMKCQVGPDLLRLIITSGAQMAADILGDLLILTIPIRLLWAIRIPWSQKLALASTLCLSIIMILMTVFRAVGLQYRGVVDAVWETFWNVLATEIGIILVSLTAFRNLFVAQTSNPNSPRKASPMGGRMREWYHSRRRLLARLTGSHRWTGSTKVSIASDETPPHLSREMPRATITGMRTYINGVGHTTLHDDDDHEEQKLWGSGLPPKQVHSMA